LESVDLLLLGERLPPGIEVFSSVKELKLSVMREVGSRLALSELPQALAAFGRLERLRIEHAGFDAFPEVVYDLSSLRELHMLNSRIGQFPIGISRMKQLRRINWSNMEMSAPPPDLGNRTRGRSARRRRT
jgi:hypothetical protein